MKKTKEIKYTILTLIFMCTLYVSHAQVFDKTPPSTTPSSNGYYSPFTSKNQPPPMLRAIGGGGDGPGNPTGGEDDPGNVNDNAPVEDVYWLLPLLAISYGIYSRQKGKKAR